MEFETSSYRICGFMPPNDKHKSMTREYHGGTTYVFLEGAERFRIMGAFVDPEEMRSVLIGAWAGWRACEKEPMRLAYENAIVKVFRTELAAALAQVRSQDMAKL